MGACCESEKTVNMTSSKLQNPVIKSDTMFAPVEDQSEALPEESDYSKGSTRRIKKDWVKLPDGSRYKGEWLGDVMDGHGIHETKAGARYEGQMANDVYEGRGKLTSQSSIYSGEWLRGLRNGFGEEDWVKTGDHYEGYYQAGERHGKGKLNYADGSVYQGGFVRNEQSG